MRKRHSVLASSLALTATFVLACLLAVAPMQTTALAGDGGGGPCPGEAGSGGTVDDSLSQVVAPPPDGTSNLSLMMLFLFEAIF